MHVVWSSYHSRIFIPLTVVQEMKNKNKRGEAISIILTDILILEIMVPGGRTVKNRACEEYSLQSLQCNIVLLHQHVSLKSYKNHLWEINPKIWKLSEKSEKAVFRGIPINKKSYLTWLLRSLWPCHAQILSTPHMEKQWWDAMLTIL